MHKEIKGYLIIAGITLVTIAIYKAVIKQFVPASIQAYLP